jgi:hypothetical protein
MVLKNKSDHHTSKEIKKTPPKFYLRNKPVVAWNIKSTVHHHIFKTISGSLLLP